MLHVLGRVKRLNLESEDLSEDLLTMLWLTSSPACATAIAYEFLNPDLRLLAIAPGSPRSPGVTDSEFPGESRSLRAPPAVSLLNSLTPPLMVRSLRRLRQMPKPRLATPPPQTTPLHARTFWHACCSRGCIASAFPVEDPADGTAGLVRVERLSLE